MRILQLITPKRFSGAERVCAEICEELRERGHVVLVATKPNAAFEAALTAHGIPYQTARLGNKFDFSRPLAIRRLARTFRADLIHTHLSTAAQWGTIGAYLAGIPCVSHVHATGNAIWYVWSTRIIAVAEAIRRSLIAQNRSPDRIRVVYNAVDLPSTEIDTAALRADLGIPFDVPVVAVAAHLSPKKGIHILLHALRQLKDRHLGVHCIIMGEGPLKPRLRALAADLDLEKEVSLVGFRSDARDIMAASEIVVLPSVSGEGLPLSLLEAMARCRPVIGTRLGGVPELIADGEAGFVVTPGDKHELADRLAELVEHAELRERMGQLGRKRVESLFTRSKRAEAIEAVYEEALAAKRSSRG
ncbi:MAG: glycosyltransferase family 4 protein [Candidatus Zipacnadales bacterium]